MAVLLSGRPRNRGSIPGANAHRVSIGRDTHPASSVPAGGCYRRRNLTVLHLLPMLTMHGVLPPLALPTLCTSAEFCRVKYINWELSRLLQSCVCYSVPSGKCCQAFEVVFSEGLNMKVEALGSRETSETICQSIQDSVPEDLNVQQHRCCNMRRLMDLLVSTLS